jgi:glyoxylase-like metal-dependent hydrolase (beta-lactamase superfamily II)/rhodanese-related sulfurtransferase
MDEVKEITPRDLRNWLEAGKPVSILDVRPVHERAEWFIPGSIYVNAYDKLKAHHPEALQGLHLDRTVPVVTACAGGKTSMLAARLLQQQGFEVYSLKGGMKAWSLAWNTASIAFPEFEIIQFRRTGKGCLSYLLVSKNEAIAVDASLPIEVYIETLKEKQLNLVQVIETHIHADHLSRSKLLADSYNKPIALPVPNHVSFDYAPLDGNSLLKVGNVTIKVIPAPGHTPESVCFLVDDKVLLTGDTLFVNGVGRPDLKAGEQGTIEKARMLYKSLKRILELPEDIIVMPGHSNQPIDFDDRPVQTTIGNIKKSVSILQLTEQDFINTILQRIPPAPANYQLIVDRNYKGDLGNINPIDLEAGANNCAIPG